MSRLTKMRKVRVIDDYGIFPKRHEAIKLLSQQHNALLECCIELESRVQVLEQRMQELERKGARE